MLHDFVRFLADWIVCFFLQTWCNFCSHTGSAWFDTARLACPLLRADMLPHRYPPTCMGNDNFNVGKEASTGFKPGCGQCTDNSGDFGSWYSLAAKGECTSGGPPDGKHCTWRRIRRRKTVSVLCSSFAGFFAKCAAETAIPFTAASASLGQIFASETVADGGCPALPYP